MVLSVEQAKQVNLYMKNNPKATREEAIEAVFGGGGSQNTDKGTIVEKSKEKVINLPSGRKIVISGGKTKYFAADGKQLVEKYFEQQEGKIYIKPSGRYSVTKNGKTRYFAANGTEINESYFKQVENPDVTVQVDGKTYNLNKTIEKRMSNVTSGLKKTEGENGYIGASWSWAKNTIGFGDSSDKVRELQSSEQDLLTQFNSNPARRAEIFKQLTEVDYTPENLVKFIKGEIKLKSELALAGYKEGQEMAVDVTADIVTGIVTAPISAISVAGIIGAPETGGLSLAATAVGVTSGAVSGAIIKPLIKWSDAKSGGREYTTLQRDAATGAVSGALGSLTFGAGSAVRSTVAATGERVIAKFVGKEVVTEAAKQTTKQTVAKGAVAFTAKSTEYSVSGAMFGAGDTAFRTAYDGGSAEEIFDSALEGGAYGAAGGFIFGHGANAVGKSYRAVKGAFSDDVVPIPQAKSRAVPEYYVDEFGQVHLKNGAEPVKTEVEVIGHLEDDLPIIKENDNNALKAKRKALKAQILAKEQSGSQVTSSGNEPVPRGYIRDAKTGNVIKVDIDKIKVERNTVGESILGISIKDEFGNELGSVGFSPKNIRCSNGQEALVFEGLISNVEGIGIGTKLIDELKKLSYELGYEGRLTATASPLRVAGNKTQTNLKFYYKCGFKAIDPEEHAKILDCINKNEEIPSSLNVMCNIELY